MTYTDVGSPSGGGHLASVRPDVDDADDVGVTDRVRWSAVWAGVVTTIATFALLQLVFFATSLVDLDVNPGQGTTDVEFWTAVAAVVAFLLGGLVAGSSARFRKADDGLLQGIVMWAVTIAGLLLASSLAVGALTSSLGGSLGRLGDIRSAIGEGTDLTSGQLDDARSAAASAALFLGLTIVAAAIGATAGALSWPRRAQRTIGDRPAITDRPIGAGDRTMPAPRP